MSKLDAPKMQTRYFLDPSRTLVIDLGTSRRVVSSAPRGGGLLRTRYILNHQVRANPVAKSGYETRKWEDPTRYLARVASALGADRRCVALMTAVSLKHLVALREEAHDLWVEGFFTVGVSNAVRAGEPATSPGSCAARHAAGTINIILVTNARLSASAMVGAVQVATESKTAVLLSQRIRSWTGRSGATGTGTDAVVVACGHGPVLRYSGTHTKIGEMIGRLVARGVTTGLLRCERWHRRSG